MKNSNKIALGSLFVFVIVMLVIVISTKTVPKSQVVQDIIDETSLDIGDYITDSEDIKNVKYLMTKKVMDEKDFRELYLPVAVHIENDFVKGDFYINLFYDEIDHVWQLDDSYSMGEKIAFKKEMDNTLLQAIIQENYSYMTVEEIDIESVEVDEDNLEQYVEANLVMNDGMVQYNESVGLYISYGKAWDNTSLWQIEDFDVYESEENLISGVDEEYIEEMLSGCYIVGWSDNPDDDIYISSPLQIDSLEISERETDLDNFKDHVVVAISLVFENMTVEGNLDLLCYYDQEYGWDLDDVKAIGNATTEIIEKFDLSEDDLRSDLYGVRMSYGFYHSLDIEETNLMTFSIGDVSYSEQGMYADVPVSLEVLNRDKIIKVNAMMTYERLEDEWELSEMSKEGAIDEMSFGDYKAKLNAVKVNRVLASSEREPMGEYTYVAENLIDRDVDTAWVEGAEDEGKGEWAEFFFDGDENLQIIEFYLGYQSSYDRYQDNLRPVGLKIIYSDGEETFYEASDDREAQYLYIRDVKPVKSVKIVIEETTGTDSYLDTCISDINFYSRP